MKNKDVSNTRFKLEEARFFFKKMKESLQNREEFSYYLDAFLAIARSVTDVFKSEFHENNLLMKLYNGKKEAWKESKIMKSFWELRNKSTRVASDFKEHCISSPLPLEVRGTEVLGYHFIHNFKWLNEIPDVVSLCKQYLDELESFVSEVEKAVAKKKE